MSRMARIAGLGGCLLAALGVLCGAFGAHALRGTLDPQAMAVWQTAVQNEFLHALALLQVAVICARRAGKAAGIASVAFFGGTLLFCGSLYALALGAPRGVGVATPIGGLAFVLGWIALGCAFVRADR
jgi:uncharacterized membrane protein YgdD (TMEM256/DUF423 family)